MNVPAIFILVSLQLLVASQFDVNFNNYGGCGGSCGGGGGGCSECPEGGGQTYSDGGKLSIFDEPTIEEMDQALARLDQEIDLDCSPDGDNLYCDRTDKFNYVTVIDPIFPKKSDALAYLDDTTGTVDRPERFLKVTVNRGAFEPADIMDYKVGPFPADELSDLTVTELLNPPLPYEARARDGLIINAVKHVVADDLSITLATLISESFDGAVWDAENGGGNLNMHATAPAGYAAGNRTERCFLTLNIPNTSRVKDLFPLALTWRVIAQGADPRSWTATQWFYARQGPYETAADLAAAYADVNSGLTKVTYPENFRQKAIDYATPVRPINTVTRGPYVTKAGPSFYYPEGKRYTISNRVVEWMGWKFHMTSVQKRGPVLHAISFLGKRIAYEVSVQDVSLGYSGKDPVQGNVFYFDGSFAIGETSDYIPHVDCPSYADFIPNNWYAGSPTEVTTAMCVYEQYTGDALWRRKEGVKSGMPESNLIVKFSLPVGNYDYIATFRFTLDGAMHTHYAASGNIQTYPFLPEFGDTPRDPFAVRFFDRSYGALHDHTFSVKVDLDVLGERNNFYTNSFPVTGLSDIPGWESEVPSYIECAEFGQCTDFVRDPSFSGSQIYPGSKAYRWVNREHQQTEVGFEENLQDPKEFEFTAASDAEDRENKWGVDRAYRIKLHRTSVNGFRGGQHPLQTAGRWRDYQIAVTERKDEEEVSDSGYALWAPLVGADVFFEDYLNQESIVDKDLVAWVSFGFLHLPRAEDSPVQPVAGGGFVIEPVNYFDENPTFDIPHLVENMGTGQILEELPSGRPCMPRDNDN